MIVHPELGAVNYELAEVAEDPQGQVADVIGLMRRYVVEDARSPVVRADLDKALAEIPGGKMEVGIGGGLSDPDKAAAIFYYVRSRVAFVQDDKISSPLQSRTTLPIVEALIRPVDMAGMCNAGGCRLVGDCDDFAMYTAALLLAAGIPCSFVTVAADPADPERMSHVYVAAYTPQGRIPLDTSHGDYPGWESQAVYERREWPVGGMLEQVFPWLALAAAAWWAARNYKSWRTVWA